MKTITILTLLLLVGCASGPQRPNNLYILQEIQAGRMKGGDVERMYADYDKARAEYEASDSFKWKKGLLLTAIVPLLILGSAANGLPFGPASQAYGYRSPGKVVINSTPTSSGGYRTTIDPMY